MPSFSVDGGFWYDVPDGFEIQVGTVVRVPLAGRVVRGWVTALDEAEARPGLKPIRQVSGDFAVFDELLLRTLQWCARHYVAPQAVLLKKAAPPNLPRRMAPLELAGLPEPGAEPPAPGDDTEPAHHGPPKVIVGDPQPAQILATVEPVLADGGSALIIYPTGLEATRAHDAMQEVGNRRMLVHPDMSDRQVTTRWSRTRDQPGFVVIGTERLSTWPICGLRLAWVMGDGRRGLKARQTPTLNVRDVLSRRSATERFSLVTATVVPSVESLAAGFRVQPPPRRVWPRTEIVDRGEDPPGSGVIGRRVRAALASVFAANGTAFVFTHRHGFAPAFRCVSCRTLRNCRTCSARAVGDETCRRCGAELGPCTECSGRVFEPLGAAEGRVRSELAKVLGPDAVGGAGSESPMWVGTERDLPLVQGRDLAVAVDADALIFGTNYRSPEDALRVLARVALTVRSGPSAPAGSRLMVQTSRPSHPVLAALQRGHPFPLLESMLDDRRVQHAPPFSELLVLEVTDPPGWVDERLAPLEHVVLGSALRQGTRRWLLQADDLTEAKSKLRPIVQEMRDAGAKVRVDADPLDL